LRRQRADPGRMNARGVDQAGDFDGAILRQRGDAAAVALIAVDPGGLAGPDRIDDRGGVFPAFPRRLIPLTQVALDVVSPTRPSFLRSGEDELDGERALTCGIPTGFS
jgi:hypothetical protein